MKATIANIFNSLGRVCGLALLLSLLLLLSEAPGSC